MKIVWKLVLNAVTSFIAGPYFENESTLHNIYVILKFNGLRKYNYICLIQVDIFYTGTFLYLLSKIHEVLLNPVQGI